MAEPRKIVLILGNGFDLDLGLKTSYKDFWESEFCPKDYPAPLIQHLNDHWKEDMESVRWYDLENELHAYAIIEDKTDVIDEKQRSYIRTHSDYELTLASTYNGVDDVFTSLVQTGIIRIAGVLRSAYIPFRDDLLESATWRDRKAVELIKEGLCKYLKSISGEATVNHSIALSVLLAANCARESGDFLNIYTFNYTPLPVDHGNGFQNIVHYVHGNCEKGKIIIGTRDDGEIDEGYDFLQKSFDPNFNPPSLVAYLLEADEVIIFGHSIGENDRQYFKAFFKQQTDFTHPNQKEIIIFTWDDDSEVGIKRSLQKMTDNNLSSLYGLNHVEIIKTSNFPKDSNTLRMFLSRHISNEIQVSVTYNQLLEEYRNNRTL